MTNESLVNSQIDNLEAFYAPLQDTPCSPEKDAIVTQVINIRIPNCDSKEGENDKIAEMSVNFCMPKTCMEGEDDKFARKLETIVKVDDQGYILKPDNEKSLLKLDECVKKLRALVSNDDIAFLRGKIIATCREGDTECKNCVQVVNEALEEGAKQYASPVPEMYGDSDTYDNAII